VHALLHKNIGKQLEMAGSSEDEYLRIQTVGDQLVSEQIRTVRSKDGSSRTIRTIHRHKTDGVGSVVSVGSAKIVSGPESNILEPGSEQVPYILGSILNSEEDLEGLQGKVVDPTTMEEIVQEMVEEEEGMEGESHESFIPEELHDIVDKSILP
jgi:hypothetical protein